MTRGPKLIRDIAIGLIAFLLLAGVAAVVIIQTPWFRDFVRQKIVASTEDATGGRVEIGSFDLDIWHLRVVATNFVLHGKEPAGSAPFLRADRAQVDLWFFGISYVGIQHPQANLIVASDGTTNAPTPKQPSNSNTSALQTVVDLAIGHFDLTNGVIAANDRIQDLNVHANNVRAQLTYSSLKQSYQGELSLEPVYVIAGRNTPVTFRVTLPVTLAGDRIDIRAASITTPHSMLQINASMAHMKEPVTSAHVTGHIALADLKALGNLPIRDMTSSVNLDADATVGPNQLDIRRLHVDLGKSGINASGTRDNLKFSANLALAEAGNIAQLSARPDGDLTLDGAAQFMSTSNYRADASLQARNVSVTAGQQRIRNINLTSAVHLDPRVLQLSTLRLTALGGEFAGDARLEEFARYQVNGNLRGFDLQQVLRQFVPTQQIPYDGVLAGSLQASGDVKTPGTKGVSASARMNIQPGRRGIPVTGRVDANYNGSTDDITLRDSFVELPHSRLNLSGSVGHRLDFNLTSRDLNDLLAALPASSRPAVVLNNSQASVTGTVNGSLSAPRIAAHLAIDRLSVEGRQFSSLRTDLAASKSGAAVTDGAITRTNMTAAFAGEVGLHNWSATPNQPLTADVSLTNGDLADIIALAGESPGGYSGALSANAHIFGTVGNPQGNANIQGAHGSLDGEPFDQLKASVNLADQLVTIPAAYVTSGPSRVDLTAEFQHPRDSFTTGRVHAHLRSNQVDLARIPALQREQPNSGGILQMDADLTGDLAKSDFLLTAVNGGASLHGLRLQGQSYGDITANARTGNRTVTYKLDSDFAGSNIHADGNTRLETDYPTTADVSIRNLQIAPLLALAKEIDVRAKGVLSGTAHVSGTIANPQGNADLTLANAMIQDEPLDRVHASVTYLANSIDVPQFEIAAGPARIDLTAHYDHAPGNLSAGSLRFRVNFRQIELARIRNLQKLRPGLGGELQLSADGAANIRNGDPQILLTGLNANVMAKGIAAQGKIFGDLNLTANTSTGGRMNFNLTSNLANSSITGNGNAELNGTYPVNARLSFKNVTWNKLQPLLATGDGEPPSFDAAVDGEVSIAGPATNVNRLHGSATVSLLRAITIPRQGSGAKPVVLQNDGPLIARLDNGLVHLDSVKLTGPSSNIQAGGTANIQTGALNLTLNANADLALLESFDRDLDSSGRVLVATTVHGSAANPLVNGTLQLQNAALHYGTVTNGISNANGTILFNGNSATIASLTAQSGGGTITAGGFVGFASANSRFALHANASRVRVLLQQGVSVVTNGNIQLSGTAANSTASGTVTITTLTYRPQSDLGSMLSRAGPSVEVAATPSPLLQNMRLDVRVRTSPALAVQSSLAENLQADANLHVQGTAARPAILGRVNISEGKVVFFGATYSVNSGSIGFYNPVRIDPILDVSLETMSKGVDVVLHVTGPVDNMKLSYSSDPPLQFQEIVSLLAAGQTPTSDPTLLANQPAQPAQTFQQMGESAIVGAAVADPVSSRLQRVFGVSQLKIDPSFVSGSQVPQARLTLQQQISSNLTFTYVSALNDPNSTVIRMEWAFSPQWSAIANRDENGIFSLNFFYKKHFR